MMNFCFVYSVQGSHTIGSPSRFVTHYGMGHTIKHRYRILDLSVVLSGILLMFLYISGRRGGLMVSVLVPGASGKASDPSSSPGRGHCVVFLG